jgi:arabinose-5-phosphate isomerase
MTKYPKGVALMIDEKNLLLGLLTDGDMRRVLSSYVSNEISIEEFITYTPTVIDIGESLAAALSTMTSNKPKRISVLPVTKNGEVVGVITMNDIEQRRNINARH